jgi:hypothetical protein
MKSFVSLQVEKKNPEKSQPTEKNNQVDEFISCSKNCSQGLSNSVFQNLETEYQDQDKNKNGTSKEIDLHSIQKKDKENEPFLMISESLTSNSQKKETNNILIQGTEMDETKMQKNFDYVEWYDGVTSENVCIENDKLKLLSGIMEMMKIIASKKSFSTETAKEFCVICKKILHLVESYDWLREKVVPYRIAEDLNAKYKQEEKRKSSRITLLHDEPIVLPIDQKEFQQLISESFGKFSEHFSFEFIQFSIESLSYENVFWFIVIQFLKKFQVDERKEIMEQMKNIFNIFTSEYV